MAAGVAGSGLRRGRPEGAGARNQRGDALPDRAGGGGRQARRLRLCFQHHHRRIAVRGHRCPGQDPVHSGRLCPGHERHANRQAGRCPTVDEDALAARLLADAKRIVGTDKVIGVRSSRSRCQLLRPSPQGSTFPRPRDKTGHRQRCLRRPLLACSPAFCAGPQRPMREDWGGATLSGPRRKSSVHFRHRERSAWTWHFI